MIAKSIPFKDKFSTEQLFMMSAMLVNGGNYLYNLVLGRFLGPEKFADAAILITLLLVLSFAAMTFQLVTAKFSVIFEDSVFQTFIVTIYKSAVVVGVFLGITIVLLSSELQEFFKTTSSSMFVVFGIGIPFYFLMSVNRGVFQGQKELIPLSATYQLEMMSRLTITFGLLCLFEVDSSLLIAIGILCSFIVGLLPFKFKEISLINRIRLKKSETKMVRNFFIITAFYELTLIIINNSDILLVKHYFDSYEAGLYASLALIGRVVYFVAWMFVMLLLPTVVQLKKQGISTRPILFKYVIYIAVIAVSIVLGCYLFPNQIINILFGNDYIEVGSLLWKYAFATGVFAVSNIFAYYYLSLDKYVPIIFSGVFGLLQIALIVQFHTSLEQVVHVQIFAMILLLLMQIAFFVFDENISKDKSKSTIHN
ncbi:oligosaccharide flippase family protein [Flavobacteriaceae bacterium]|nr:oligosaccharide flippase family protein [Flavobacteriaceae bacterium]